MPILSPSSLSLLLFWAYLQHSFILFCLTNIVIAQRRLVSFTCKQCTLNGHRDTSYNCIIYASYMAIIMSVNFLLNMEWKLPKYSSDWVPLDILVSTQLQAFQNLVWPIVRYTRAIATEIDIHIRHVNFIIEEMYRYHPTNYASSTVEAFFDFFWTTNHHVRAYIIEAPTIMLFIRIFQSAASHRKTSWVNTLTPEKATGLVHRYLSVSRAPWAGMDPRRPRLQIASAIPIRALIFPL